VVPLPVNEPPGPARPDEAAALFELLSAQLVEHAIPLAPRLLAEAIAGALADDGRALILVAREEGRTVGVAYLSFHWTLERGGNVLWVEELYVLPDRRGRGIGTQLLQAALDLARARRCLAVELEVESSHARAANLYARAGFRPLDRIHWALPLG
jgi:GNAT superfamily N-acetyltransferase